MKENPISLAIKAKGRAAFTRRIKSIYSRYGLSSASMHRSLRQYADLAQQHDIRVTFPITAAVLKRYSGVIKSFQSECIEFIIHGYTHVDLSSLSHDELQANVEKAIRIFNEEGISALGFRSPYLRKNFHLNSILENAGISYISNQPFYWNNVETEVPAYPDVANTGEYLEYYEPLLSTQELSVPRIVGKLVEIPVSLPDDEILIERMAGNSSLINNIWQQILELSYRQGELFTLQLHPERISLVADSLRGLLIDAKSRNPIIWCASLAEIANWWKALYQAAVDVSTGKDGSYHFSIQAINEVTILARGVDVDSSVASAFHGYQAIRANKFRVLSPKSPLIGVSHTSSSQLVDFLKQQGYIIELSDDRERYAYYIDLPQFESQQARSIIDSIENSHCPLIRLGRWPEGAQSALAITGDIDAMTLWDYGLRFIGR